MRRILQIAVLGSAVGFLGLFAGSQSAEAQDYRYRDGYWRNYWRWYDRDYSPYYHRRYQRPYYGRGYYDYHRGYRYPYYGGYGRGYRGGGGVQIGPLGVWWR